MELTTVQRKGLTNLRNAINTGYGRLGSYGFLYDDGSILADADQACYAGAVRMGVVQPGKEAIIFCDSPYGKKALNGLVFEEQKNYLRWLLKKSPFKNIFLNKTMKDLFEKGCIIDASFESKLAYQAAMAFRITRETPFQIRSWNELVQRGLTANQAFVLMPVVKTISVEAVYFDNGYWGSGHSCFNKAATKPSTLTYFGRKPQRVGKKLGLGGHYRGQDSMWNELGSLSWQEFFGAYTVKAEKVKHLSPFSREVFKNKDVFINPLKVTDMAYFRKFIEEFNYG